MSGKTHWYVAVLILSDHFRCTSAPLGGWGDTRREVYKVTSLLLRATVCFQYWPHVWTLHNLSDAVNHEVFWAICVRMCVLTTTLPNGFILFILK